MSASDEVLESEDLLEGENLLDWLEVFLARFISYPSADARVAHVLWIAHTWFMERWVNTPRIAFLSPEPGSGKSRALELTACLVPRPVHAVNVTSSYVFRKISDKAGLPTLIMDESDTIFGPKARANEELRGVLNAGHRRGAKVGRCAVVGSNVVTEELDSFCAVALAGLGNLPDTILSRSVVIEMHRRARSEQIDPWRERISGQRAEFFHQSLARWASSTTPNENPPLPLGLEDRAADVWEPLIAIADHAGECWGRRARSAALALVAIGRDRHEAFGPELLQDIQTILDGREQVFTRDLVAKLRIIEDSQWSDVDGKPLDGRVLAKLLKGYGVRPVQLRIGPAVGKGYRRADFQNVFDRYLPDSILG